MESDAVEEDAEEASPGLGEPVSLGASHPAVRLVVDLPQPDVAGGEWFWHVSLQLHRQGRRELRLRSDVRGWTEAEAIQRSRELARDLARGGVQLARDPADVDRIAELEAELAEVRQLDAGRGVQRQVLLAEAREREDRDQVRALIRRAIAAAANSPGSRVAGPGLACQVSLRSGLALDGLLSETPEGILALQRLSEGRPTGRCHVFAYGDVVSVTLSLLLPEAP